MHKIKRMLQSVESGNAENDEKPRKRIATLQKNKCNVAKDFKAAAG